jgi:hypothetical protein
MALPTERQIARVHETESSSDIESQSDRSSKGPLSPVEALTRAVRRLAGSWMPSKQRNTVTTETEKPKIEVIEEAEEVEDLYLLVCIEKCNGTRHLVQINVGKVSSDKILFQRLREEYEALRGKWRARLSLLCLQSITFVHFELWGASEEVDVLDHRSLPPASRMDEYSYEAANTFPPVGETRLMHLWNSPNHLDGDGQTVLSRFPKRRRERLHVDVGKTADGWGIHLVEGLNWLLIWLLIFLVALIGSCVFGISFAVLHKDIQSSFAISSYVVSFAAFCIGTCSMCSRRMASTSATP